MPCVSVERLLFWWRGEAAGRTDPAHRPAHLPQHPPERDAEPVQLLQLPQPVSRTLGAGWPLRVQGPVRRSVLSFFIVNSFFEFFVPRFLYSIGPRVWAVDPALQLEGPGLLHKEGPEDSECFDQWRGSKCGPSSFFPSSWTEWTGPQVGPQVMRRTNRITDYERGIMDMMSPL